MGPWLNDLATRHNLGPTFLPSQWNICIYSNNFGDSMCVRAREWNKVCCRESNINAFQLRIHLEISRKLRLRPRRRRRRRQALFWAFAAAMPVGVWLACENPSVNLVKSAHYCNEQNCLPGCKGCSDLLFKYAIQPHIELTFWRLDSVVASAVA